MDERETKIHAWLILRLRSLVQDVRANMDELQVDGHHLADLEELASDVSADGVVFEQFRSSADEIEQIERALDRLEQGEYGRCEDCETEITAERLEAIPYTSHCIDCKRRAEETTLG
ncbi:MAG: TraR/DksA family transcriptional regulator [Planctomycetota bacterium]